MKRFATGLAAAVCGLLAAGAVRAGPMTIPAETGESRSTPLKYDSMTLTDSAGTHTRNWYYYVPSTGMNGSVGVMFFLHGGNSNGLTAARHGTDYQWTALADKYHVLVVFPDGEPFTDSTTPDANNEFHRSWNNCSDQLPNDDQGHLWPDYMSWDDVGFIRKLITWAQGGGGDDHDGAGPRFAPVNASRAYVAGHSEGSKMVERLALEANDVIAAAVSSAGDLPLGNDNGALQHPPEQSNNKCNGYVDQWAGSSTDRFVPLMLVKGDLDPRISFGDPGADDPSTHDVAGEDTHDDIAHDRTRVCQVKDGGGTPQSCVSGLQHSYFETLGFWQYKLKISSNRFTPMDRNPDNTPKFALVNYDDTPVDRCKTATEPKGCSFTNGHPTNADLTGPDAIDGSQVTRYTYGPAVTAAGGGDTYRLVFMRINGGGHCFQGPDEQDYVSTDTTKCHWQDSGWKNRDYLLTNGGNDKYIVEKMWTFLKNWTLTNTN